MASKNVASKGHTDMQIGHVAGGKDKTDTPKPAPAAVNAQNVRSGNATVGAQVDTINGGLTFRW